MRMEESLKRDLEVQWTRKSSQEGNLQGHVTVGCGNLPKAIRQHSLSSVGTVAVQAAKPAQAVVQVIFQVGGNAVQTGPLPTGVLRTQCFCA